MAPRRLHLTPGDYRRMPWKNGGGSTTEILVEPRPRGEGFLFRLSSAEVTADGPFSDFSGYVRTLLLLRGHGLELDFEEAPSLRLARLFEPVVFDGAWHASGRLVSGPVLDLGLIATREAGASLSMLPLAAGDRVTRPLAPTTVVHVVEGRLVVDGDPLTSGDTLRIVDDLPGHVALSAEGPVVAVWIAIACPRGE